VKHFIYFLLVLFSAQYVLADDVEEITVTASLIDEKLSDLGEPVHILSGVDLDAQGRASLGESIDSLLGVSNADYGFSAGQPVIRGLSGNRVKILKNGMVNRDVSAIGVDHPVEIDMNNIQQIEVVRGPSSLLYANGGVGGIINIVDNTIARKAFQEKRLI
jgi:Outer membrane cobalamin receptor protein